MKRMEAQKGKWVVVLVLFFGLSVMGWSEGAWAQQKTFKIGYLAGLTGPFAPYNLPAQIGIKLAVDEMNAAGGFLGQKIEYTQGI